MSDLFVVEFPSEEQAESARSILLAMRREYPIEQRDAVIAVHDNNGAIKLNRLFHPTAGGGASEGPWEALIAALLLAPPGGHARDALRGLGFGDDFVTRAARTLRSGNAVLLLLIRAATTGEVRTALRRVGGPVLHTTFDETKEDTLRAALAGAGESSGKTAG